MLIDHVRNVSYDCIYILGTILSFDETMISFCGQSLEAYRMKNKPIHEDYRFFVLATKSSYIVNFTPDGQTTEKNNEQEYTTERGTGKNGLMILHVLSVLEKIKEKQRERMRKRNCATRNDNNNMCNDTNNGNIMDAFCIAWTIILPFLR